MPGVQPSTFELEDFKDPVRFEKFRDDWNRMQSEINRLAGLNGPVAQPSGIDLQNTGTIVNVAVVQPSSSSSSSSSSSTPAANTVLTPATVAPIIGPTANQALEATGTHPLQTVRRLNDQQQREEYSSFLNDVLNLPPVSNTSTISVAASGSNSVITVAAGTFMWGDGSVAAYAQRVDTVPNPATGSTFYFYYLRKSDKTLQFTGPFTVNTSANQLTANMDGRGFIGTATVNSGGGGSGGGGGTSGGGGGCFEVGTPFSVPHGKKWSMVIEPCENWVVLHFADGKKVVAARDTRIAVFRKVQDLDSDDLLCDEQGNFIRVEKLSESFHSSHKMKISVEGRVYYAANVLVSNFKPNI